MKVVNIFYLVTAILNYIPSIRVNKPAATIVPLSFVILLGIAKELIAELKRYKEDKKTNAITALRLKDGKSTAAKSCKDDDRFEESNLADIKCGDILKIRDGEQVPADCILLKTESLDGDCFVKTSQLDGERNLKPKLVKAVLQTNFDKIFKQGNKEYIAIEAIPPTKDLYHYNGRIMHYTPEKSEPDKL